MTEKEPSQKKGAEKEGPDTGNNFKAGQEEAGTLPNNPAKNAEKKSPEEEKGEKEDTKLHND